MGPALACYFRRSWYLGKENVPAKGPVVVISNHAASFLDAMLMGVMLDRPIHYFVRGDIFKKKWVQFIFGQLHMIPLYSADLAKDQLHKNAESFSKGEEVLKKGGLLLIFPEGLSRLERNMMPLKKGVSRIILQTLASDPHLKINVVPIGIHYSRHAVLSDVQLVAGEAMDVSGYREVYAENQPKAVNELTQGLDQILRKVVLYVAQGNRSGIIETQLEMFDNERRGKYTVEDFRAQKKLCDSISDISDDKAEELASNQEKYQSLLKKYDLNDAVIAGKKNVFIPSVLLLLSLPLFLTGVIFNILPFLFGKWMADNKVTRQDFYSSVITAVSAISYVVWMALLLVIALVTQHFLLLVLVVLSPLLGWFAIRWWEHFNNWKFRRKYKQMKKRKPGIINEISALRQLIRSC